MILGDFNALGRIMMLKTDGNMFVVHLELEKLLMLAGSCSPSCNCVQHLVQKEDDLLLNLATRWFQAMVDYCITRQRDRRRCTDVSVKTGAECNTNHQLLRVKLRVSLGRQQCCTIRKQGVCRFSVEKVKGSSVDDDGQNTTQGLFQEQV